MSFSLGESITLACLMGAFLTLLQAPRKRRPEEPDPKRRRAWTGTKPKPRFWLSK
jgi:hypothetical protein